MSQQKIFSASDACVGICDLMPDLLVYNFLQTGHLQKKKKELKTPSLKSKEIFSRKCKEV